MDEQNVDYSHNGLLLRQTRNEILIRATRWMNPENTTVSGRRQTQKATCKIPFMLNVHNIHRDRKISSDCQGLERGRNGEWLLMGCEYNNSHQIVHLKC